MDAERELVDSGLLAAQIVDADLGVGHTAAEARLGVRLVLAVAVATRGTATHLDGCSGRNQGSIDGTVLKQFRWWTAHFSRY